MILPNRGYSIFGQEWPQSHCVISCCHSRLSLLIVNPSHVKWCVLYNLFHHFHFVYWVLFPPHMDWSRHSSKICTLFRFSCRMWLLPCILHSVAVLGSSFLAQTLAHSVSLNVSWAMPLFVPMTRVYCLLMWLRLVPVTWAAAMTQAVWTVPITGLCLHNIIVSHNVFIVSRNVFQLFIRDCVSLDFISVPVTS
jgi:hypothetical protein